MRAGPRWHSVVTQGLVAVAIVIAIAGCDDRKPVVRKGLQLVDPTTAIAASPTACRDPYTGLWLSNVFDDGYWQQYRLTISRTGAGLRCQQEARWWPGSEADSIPPACPSGGPSFMRTTIRCEAAITSRGLEARGMQIVSRQHSCGGDDSNYNLDWFFGSVHGNTWDTRNQTTNNGEPYEQQARFHRIACGT